MKFNKYKETYSKLNTDASMDQRITNNIINYENRKESKPDQIIQGSYKRSKFKWSEHHSSRFSAIQPILTSVFFIVFMGAVLFGIRARLVNEKSPQDNLTEAQAIVTVNPSTDVIQTDVTNEEGNAIPTGQAEDILLDNTNENPKVVITATPIPQVTQGFEEEMNNSQKQGDNLPAADGDLYFAWFDVAANGTVKTAIPNLVLRFHGTIDSIDPNDLTDVVLTRDGVPIDNHLTLTETMKQYVWGYENITDFYFKFDSANREPGNYGLTGKYKGVEFTVYNKILEGAVSEEPANPEDLDYVGWAYSEDESGNKTKISELTFGFKGYQSSFYQQDLMDLKLTLNNEEIPFILLPKVVRYLEVGIDNTSDTSYNLIFDKDLTEPGKYVLSGKYRGKEFTSMEIVIP